MTPSIEIFSFGKYRNRPIIEVANIDPGYICWAFINVEQSGISEAIYLACLPGARRAQARWEAGQDARYAEKIGRIAAAYRSGPASFMDPLLSTCYTGILDVPPAKRRAWLHGNWDTEPGASDAQRQAQLEKAAAPRCRHCGTPHGFAFGTGDCGCEDDYDVGFSL